ncbi:MAG: hypothetical protein ABIB71_01675 [Candidatus Woesearchaeota archaeon]
MKLEQLERILRESWCRESSAYPDMWTPEMPEIGQCLSTALVVNDYFGGEIMQGFMPWNGQRTRIGLKLYLRHFWNVLENGTEKDFTKRQLPDNCVFTNIKSYDREFLLLVDTIAERYELLKQRILGKTI